MYAWKKGNIILCQHQHQHQVELQDHQAHHDQLVHQSLVELQDQVVVDKKYKK